MRIVIGLWLRLRSALAEGASVRRAHPERGAVVVEWLGIGALGIAAIVAINLVLTQLGLDIVSWIRDELGVGGGA